MVKRKQSVALLSDQTLFREALTELLRGKGFTDVVAYATTTQLLQAARTRPPSVVVVDLDHEREDVLMLVDTLRSALLDSQLLVIGSALRQAAADHAIDAELETPAANTAGLVGAVEVATSYRRRSLEGERLHRLWSKVTPRQRDVMRWMATGADNRAIARKLRIGERAVKAHVSSLLATFDMRNRAQLSLLADHAGMRPPARSSRA